MKKIILTATLLLLCLTVLGYVDVAEAKEKMYQAGSAKTGSIFLYKKANTNAKKKARMKKGEGCLVLSKFRNKNGTWYQVIYTAENKRVSGYVRAYKLNVSTGISNANLNYNGVTKDNVKLKKISVDSSKTVRIISKGKDVRILGYIRVGSKRWYKVKYGKSIGYLMRSELQACDVVFEEQIKTFPSSYRKLLRSLHKEYPRWVFKPVNTGLDWNEVQKNETKPGLNVIQSTLPNGGTFGAPFSYLSTSKSCYNPATDKYTVFDGTNWYGTVSSVVAHYMDSRNSLTPEKIWQFKSLKYEGTEKKNVIKSMLNDTFMSGNYTYIDPKTKKKVTRSYASSFLTAGKRAKISAYFLAARARQELGLKGSASVSGKYPGYKGYYNYYNVGANDSRQGLAIRNGLRFAKKADSRYLKPWNTPYKAICGGAIYLSSGYIPVGQINTYFQKFNVVNKKELYRHQYMSNIQAPTSESLTAYKSYKELGILKDKYVFYIPVYRNMPSESCHLPAPAGNANNYLKSLTVKNQAGEKLSFTEIFSYEKNEYVCELALPEEGATLTISASKVSKFSTIISGTGSVEINAEPGKSAECKVVCQAQNGKKRTYTIVIKNMAPAESKADELENS